MGNIQPNAIDRIAYHINIGTPTFVPRLPSIIFGLVVAFLFVLIGFTHSYRVRKEHEDSNDVILKSRYLWVVVITVFISYYIFVAVSHYHYFLKYRIYNSKHMALLDLFERYHNIKNNL